MTRRRTPRPTLAAVADRHRLYEHSVQSPDLECELLEQVYKERRGRLPQRLREDFCGTAAICAEWVGRRRTNTAVGVDLDAATLEWGTRRHLARLTPGQRKRVALLNADVRKAPAAPADVVIALNFSYWVFRERAALRAYFKAAHRALRKDGMLILDAYGGPSAQRVMRERTQHKGFKFHWHQADYDPISGDYTCHIDFTFVDGSRMPKAFSYHWRLWSLPEIRELLAEAGFSKSAVLLQGWDADGEPDDEFKEAKRGNADEAWLAYIVAER